MQANQISRIALTEESLTEINLQDLDMMNYPGFYVESFSKHRESNVTGADWEWWFIQKDMAFGMAVQAKRLLRNNKYSIDYIPNNNVPQIFRLLDYSRQNGLTPLYCFYNYFDLNFQAGNGITWKCQSITERRALFGCSIAHGVNIYNLYNNKMLGLENVSPYMLPWHCIVCCPGFKETPGLPVGPANRAAGVLKALRATGPEIDPEPPFIKPDGPKDPRALYDYHKSHEKPPKKIELFLERKASGEAIDESFIREYWPETPPKNLAIIDAR
jgi:hypothetical protein